MSEKSYVSTSITIMASDRAMIVPGTPFGKSRIAEATLKSMLSNGTIVEIDVTKPIPIISRPPIGKSYTGPSNGAELKDTAIDTTKIGLTRKAPEKATPELLAEKEKVRKALLEFSITPPHNCRLDTLKKRLAEAQEKEIKKKKKTKSLPDAVWDVDPEKIKDTEMDILLSVYRTRCEEFELPLEQFNTVELLREKMSSQYVPSRS